MKALSDKEGSVFVASQLRGEASIKELAKLTGYKEHTVTYYLKRLVSDGLIRKRTVINTHLLGYLQYSVYLNIAFESETASKRIINSLLDSPDVIDVFRLGGDYQLGIVMRVKSVDDFNSFWEKLFGCRNVLVHEKAITNRLATTIFQRDYLASIKGKREFISYEKTNQQYELKPKDIDILDALNQISHSSVRDLARKLEIPHSTLEVTIERLKEKEIIVGQAYGLKTEELGIQSFRLLVYTRGFYQSLNKRIFDYCYNNPNVMVLTRCLGSWDYEIAIEATDAKVVQKAVEDIYCQFKEEVRAVKTLPLFKFLKAQHSSYCMCGD